VVTKTAVAPAEAGAFDRRRRACEAHRLRGQRSLGQPQHEGAVPGIAGPERIDGLHGEGGHMHDLAALEVEGALRPVRDADPGGGLADEALQTGPWVVLSRAVAQALQAEGDMGREFQHFGHLARRSVAVQDGRDAGLAREPEHAGRARLPARVAEHRVHPLWQRLRQRVRRARDGGVGVGDDDPLARRIDQDGREGRGHPLQATDAGDIDPLALEARQDLVAEPVVAEGAVEEHAATQPGDGDGRVGRRAAARDGELAGTVLLRQGRHGVQAEHLIERRDADAEDGRRHRKRRIVWRVILGRSRPRRAEDLGTSGRLNGRLRQHGVLGSALRVARG
jgi:hypothetical protein